MKIWFNGRITDENEPLLPVTDRGVLYGDALFETFRTYAGVPFRLDRHLARMAASSAFFKLTVPYESDEIRAAVAELLAANAITDAAVRVTVTRGPVAGPLGLSASGRPNVFITLRAPGYPDKLYQTGMSLIASTVRRSSFSPLSRHKTANCLDALLARQEALETGVEEALMLDEAGNVAECTTANVFAVRGALVSTPPLWAPILPGVTRSTVLEICHRLSLAATEESVTLDALRRADEVFITNSVLEVMPVTGLEGRAVGTGRPGPVCRRIHDAYRQLVCDECVP